MASSDHVVVDAASTALARPGHPIRGLMTRVPVPVAATSTRYAATIAPGDGLLPLFFAPRSIAVDAAAHLLL